MINNSHLWDNTVVRDATLINTDIDSDTVISCYTTIESCDFKDAVIKSKNDFISMHLEGGHITFYKRIKGNIGITYYFPSEPEFFGRLSKFKKFIKSNKKSIDYNRAKSLIDFAESRLK